MSSTIASPPRTPTSPGPLPPAHDVPDMPASDLEERIKPRSVSQIDVGKAAGAAVSAFCLAWLVFERVTPLSGTLGFWIGWYVLFLGIYWLVERQEVGAIAARDRLAAATVSSIGIILIGALASIIVYTFVNGLPYLRPNFFSETQEFVGPQSPATDGGGAHAIVGTLEQVGIAVFISVPLGILTALFLNEVGGRIARPVRLVIDAMSAIPSIVAGLFVFALLFQNESFVHLDKSGLLAAVALSVLMFPTVTRTAEVVLRLVPGGLREASLALGGTEWRTTRDVVLPTSRSGLGTAVILGIARAIGETAPLLLTAGGAFVMNANPFSGKQDALPLFTFRLFNSPIQSQHDRAWTGAVVLLAMVLVLFVIARILGGQGPGHIGRLKRRRLRKRGLL
jgi:phosphate transport system permease protein